jgi:hypothetical protein
VLVLTGAFGSRSRSIAQTGLVTSVERESYIEPKSPPREPPAIPGTNRRAGPPDVTASTGGMKSAGRSRSYWNSWKDTPVPAAPALLATYCADAS